MTPPSAASALRARALLVGIVAFSAVCVSAAAGLDTARAGTVRPWSPPVTVSDPHHEADELEVVGDQGGGAAIAVWVDRRRRHRSVIQSASRQPGGDWSAPMTISPIGSSEPAVALNARGEAIAIWERRTGDRKNRRMVVLQASSRSSDGSWSAPVTLTKPGESFEPRIAINDSGEAVALWEFYDPHTHDEVLQSASRPASGVWSAPIRLPRRGPTYNYEGYFQIAIDAAGEATAVWARFNPRHEPVLEAASQPAGGAWSRPIRLAKRPGRIDNPLLVIDATGEAVALWEREGPALRSETALESASRLPGGAWSPPVTLVQLSRDSLSPELAVNRAGQATAIWEGTIGRQVLIQSASRQPGGTWSQAIDVFRGQPTKTHPKFPFDTPPPTNPRVAVGPTGEALVAWEAAGGADGGIRTATLPPGASWTARTLLTNPRAFGIFGNPHPLVSAGGEALVVWERFNGYRNVIESSSRPAFG